MRRAAGTSRIFNAKTDEIIAEGRAGREALSDPRPAGQRRSGHGRLTEGCDLVARIRLHERYSVEPGVVASVDVDEIRVVDAQAIPYEAGTFDCVIANHMLYHVPSGREGPGLFICSA